MTLRTQSAFIQVLVISVSLAFSVPPSARAEDGYHRDTDWHGVHHDSDRRGAYRDARQRDSHYRDDRHRDERRPIGHDWRGHGGFEYRDWHGSRHRWVSNVPLGYLALTVAGLSYLYYDGLFYQPYDSGYVVVNPPFGAVVYRLPLGYHTFWYGPHVYYYAGGAYYQWMPADNGYMVVQPPNAPVSAANLVSSAGQHIYVYPMHGQDATQTSKDRYECYLWAVQQTGYDPSEANSASGNGFPDYKRALSACLEGRGYTVK